MAIEWPSTASDPWLAAGTEPVLLPSGTAVLWEPTTVQQLMVRDALPGYLRSMALQFAGDGFVYDELNTDEQGKWRELVGQFVIAGVRAIALPGAAEFTRHKLTPADIDEADPLMPRPDLETLQQLAMHLRTVDQVNATGRLIQLERELRATIQDLDSAEAEAYRVEHDREVDEIQRSMAREVAGGLAGWSMFRGRTRGPDTGPDGGAVRDAAVVAADHLGPGGRPRPRRRPSNQARARRSRATPATDS